MSAPEKRISLPPTVGLQTKPTAARRIWVARKGSQRPLSAISPSISSSIASRSGVPGGSTRPNHRRTGPGSSASDLGSKRGAGLVRSAASRVHISCAVANMPQGSQAGPPGCVGDSPHAHLRGCSSNRRPSSSGGLRSARRSRRSRPRSPWSHGLVRTRGRSRRPRSRPV